MNDDDKAFEAFRICRIAKSLYDECINEVAEKFRKGTRFPYFRRYTFDDDRSNTWVLTFMCRSKEDKKKGRFLCMCYTEYEIEKRDKEGRRIFDSNTGKGVLMIDPVSLVARLDGKERGGMGAIMDFVPHVFNQYTERYLKPRGKENIEFCRKVESIMYRWQHFDVCGDKSSEKHTDKGFAPYDVFMYDGGIMRGSFVNEMLLRFFTYISDDMLFDEQREWQQAMHREYYQQYKDRKIVIR